MAVFIARRVVISFFVLLAATFIVYVLTALSGDPMEDLRQTQGPQRETRMAERTERMSLDLPIPVRYLSWLGGVFRGDLGVNRMGQEISTLLSQAMAATLQLVIVATVLAIIIGVLAGIVSALRQYSGFDYSVTFASFLFFSLPIFWVAVMLKEFGAIEFNNWLADPTIPLPIIAVLAVLAGLAWGAIIGGSRERRLAAFGTAAAATAMILELLSTTGWFADPQLGFAVILVVSVAAAVGFATLFAGMGTRRPLYAALIAAVGGSLLSLALEGALRDPSWLVLVGMAAATIAVCIGIGYALGGLQRRQAITVALMSGLFTGGLIFFDHFLRAFNGYSGRVQGRPISTIGSRTPNFQGDFWQTSWDAAGHIMLPTTVLILISLATYSRYTRASMLEVQNQDYVRTARSKGLTERTVVTKHAFRNALIPVTTLMAFDFGGVIGGAVITETVFGWRGMGALFIEALRNVDPGQMMGFFIVTGAAIVIFNMIADIAYAYLDPRIRLS